MNFLQNLGKQRETAELVNNREILNSKSGSHSKYPELELLVHEFVTFTCEHRTPVLESQIQ